MSESTSLFRARRTTVSLIALLIAIFIAQLAPRAEAYIYWGQRDARTNTDNIARAELDGSGVDRGFIRLDHGAALGIALGAGSIFWTHGSECYPGPPDGIGRAAVDGTEVNELFMTVTVGCGGEVAVGPDHLYWIGEGTTIARASLDGTTVEPVLISRGPTDVGCAFSEEECRAVIAGIAVDANYVYWIEGQYPFYDTLARANLDGTGATALATGIGGAFMGLAVGGGHLYWATPNSIGRANLDGSGVEREFIDAKDAVTVAVDPQHVYWSELKDGWGHIHRANLDGSNVERDLFARANPNFAVDAGSGGGSAAPGSVKAKRTQRQHGNSIRVKVEVRAQRPLKAKATGKVKPRYELEPLSKRVDAGERKTLTLKMKSKQAQEKIVAALADGRTATAKLTVKLTDAAGNTSREKLAVKLTE